MEHRHHIHDCYMTFLHVRQKDLDLVVYALEQEKVVQLYRHYFGCVFGNKTDSRYICCTLYILRISEILTIAKICIRNLRRCFVVKSVVLLDAS